MSRRRTGGRPAESVPDHHTLEFVCTGPGRGHPTVSFGHVHVPNTDEVAPWYELELEPYLVAESADEWHANLDRAAAEGVPMPVPASPRETRTFRCGRCGLNVPFRGDRLDALARGLAERGVSVFDISNVGR